jgi:hypothetical protein
MLIGMHSGQSPLNKSNHELGRNHATLTPVFPTTMKVVNACFSLQLLYLFIGGQ